MTVGGDGRHLFVTARNSYSVIVIDTTTRTVTAKVPVGPLPWGVALSPDQRRLYVANSGSDTISVIEIPRRRCGWAASR